MFLALPWDISTCNRNYSLKQKLLSNSILFSILKSLLWTHSIKKITTQRWQIVSNQLLSVNINESKRWVLISHIVRWHLVKSFSKIKDEKASNVSRAQQHEEAWANILFYFMLKSNIRIFMFVYLEQTSNITNKITKKLMKNLPSIRNTKYLSRHNNNQKVLLFFYLLIPFLSHWKYIFETSLWMN